MQHNWPGPDEKRVVAEMRDDEHSPHWEDCDSFIRHLLPRMNVPLDSAEDIVQQSLLSVKNSLAQFRYECSLKSWIARIVFSRVKDALRIYLRDKQYLHPIDTYNRDTGENEPIEIVAHHLSLEEQYIQREQIQEIITKLREHVASHASRLQKRNNIILKLHLFEGYTCDEVAQQLGIERPTVYQVIRKAKVFLREHWEE